MPLPFGISVTRMHMRNYVGAEGFSERKVLEARSKFTTFGITPTVSSTYLLKLIFLHSSYNHRAPGIE